MCLALALVPTLEFGDDRSVGRTLSGEHTVTGYRTEVHHLGLGLKDVAYLLHHLVGLLQCISRRGAHVEHHHTLVFLGHKTGLGGTQQEHKQYDRGCESYPSHPAMVEEEHHATLVLAHHCIEGGVVGGTDTGIESLLHLTTFSGGLHHHGTERRTERQGRNHGETY